MKRTVFTIASLGIVATAIGMQVANAQYAPAPPAYAPAPAYGPPGYGYAPGPYPDAVIVNPVTGRWCGTAPDGYQFCWTP